MGYCLREADRELLQALGQCISESPGQRLTLAILCRKAGMNKVKLGKGFAQLFGQTPAQFILERRMLHARHLLVETEKPVKEIAGLAGYGNAKSFHRAFRHYFSMTPSSLRKAGFTKCNL
ncbi:MAG: helix-turn-helix transcriptional regulator [Flavisolibacter sp.]